MQGGGFNWPHGQQQQHQHQSQQQLYAQRNTYGGGAPQGHHGNMTQDQLWNQMSQINQLNTQQHQQQIRAPNGLPTWILPKRPGAANRPVDKYDKLTLSQMGVSETDKRYYNQVFKTFQVQNVLRGQPAWHMFTLTGLDVAVVEKIWKLSDPYGRGFLDLQGAFVAIRLVALAQQGSPVSYPALVMDTDLSLPKLRGIELEKEPEPEPAVEEPSLLEIAQATPDSPVGKTREMDAFGSLLVASLSPRAAQRTVAKDPAGTSPRGLSPGPVSLGPVSPGSAVPHFSAEPVPPVTSTSSSQLLDLFSDLPHSPTSTPSLTNSPSIATLVMSPSRHTPTHTTPIPNLTTHTSSPPAPLPPAFDPSPYILPGADIASAAPSSSPTLSSSLLRFPLDFPSAPSFSDPELNQSDLSLSLSLPPMSAEGAWRMDHKDKGKANRLFQHFDHDRDGFVAGKHAPKLFKRYALSKEQLFSIWRLADVGRDGKLDIVEFFIAMQLAQGVKNKAMILPSELPDILQPSEVAKWLRQKHERSETAEERMGKVRMRVHHERVVDHCVGNDSANQQLLDIWQKHTDRFVEDSRFTIQSIQEVRENVENYYDLVSHKEEVIQVEKLHHKELFRSIQNTKKMTDRISDRLGRRDKELAALQALVSMGQKQVDADKVCHSESDAQLAQDRQDIARLRASLLEVERAKLAVVRNIGHGTD